MSPTMAPSVRPRVARRAATRSRIEADCDELWRVCRPVEDEDLAIGSGRSGHRFELPEADRLAIDRDALAPQAADQGVEAVQITIAGETAGVIGRLPIEARACLDQAMPAVALGGRQQGHTGVVGRDIGRTVRGFAALAASAEAIKHALDLGDLLCEGLLALCGHDFESTDDPMNARRACLQAQMFGFPASKRPQLPIADLI